MSETKSTSCCSASLPASAPWLADLEAERLIILSCMHVCMYVCMYVGIRQFEHHHKVFSAMGPSIADAWPRARFQSSTLSPFVAYFRRISAAQATSFYRTRKL